MFWRVTNTRDSPADREWRLAPGREQAGDHGSDLGAGKTGGLEPRWQLGQATSYLAFTDRGDKCMQQRISSVRGPRQEIVACPDAIVTVGLTCPEVALNLLVGCGLFQLSYLETHLCGVCQASDLLVK